LNIGGSLDLTQTDDSMLHFMPSKSELSSKKSGGVHYTPTELADFLAGQIAKHISIKSPDVLDPACGDGALLRAIQRFMPSATVSGFDLDESALAAARSSIKGKFLKADFLSHVLEGKPKELEGHPPVAAYDVVIANPPYVRTQVLGSVRSKKIADQFDLNGRVDVYHAFLDGIADVLRPGGIAGVIVSNRFMTTKAGEAIRARMLEKYDILHVWDLGDTKLFSAAVLPAILLLRKKTGAIYPHPGMSTIYAADGVANLSANSPIEALDHAGLVSVGKQCFMVEHGKLDYSKGIWRISSDSIDSWLRTVSRNTFCGFGDIGKIRVGIKTTCDKVFVRPVWPEPRPQLLRPLLNHKVARCYKALPAELHVLYPHDESSGKRHVVDLSLFPIDRAYLEANREVLEKRKYVIDGGRKWYEIWVPHKPSNWKRPKLVFPDISTKPTFWMSLGGEVVQGDCYWLQAEDEDLLWLALAVANSCFIEKFYDYSFNNKLYSGRRRFMTQYVEKFPIPDPRSSLSKSIVLAVKKIYELTPSPAAEKLRIDLELKVERAFGLKDAIG